MTSRRARYLSRRAFIRQVTATGIVGLGVACRRATAESVAPKVYRVGWLGATPTPIPDAERYPQIRAALRDLGYVEDKNLLIAFRNSVDEPSRLAALAKELVDLRVDLIIATTSGPALAARDATSTIPIVFHGLEDPVGLGLVPSLSRPAGNVTGVPGAGLIIETKRLELLKETVASTSRVALLHNGKDAGQRLRVQAAQSAASELGMRIDPIVTNSPLELIAALDALGLQLPDALSDANPATLYGINRDNIGRSELFGALLGFLVKHRLPHIGPPYQARAGFLMGMGELQAAQNRRIADVVDRVLKGTKPADIPVATSSEFELVLNLATAQKIGLRFPDGVRRRATEVIQ